MKLCNEWYSGQEMLQVSVVNLGTNKVYLKVITVEED
jgi:hypothetical protein